MTERRLSPLDALIEDASNGVTADELEEEEYPEDSWLYSLLRARSAFRALRDAQRELDNFFTVSPMCSAVTIRSFYLKDDAELLEELDTLNDRIVSLQTALSYFYRDAHEKWWLQVPEPPASAQEWVFVLCANFAILISFTTECWHSFKAYPLTLSRRTSLTPFPTFRKVWLST